MKHNKGKNNCKLLLVVLGIFFSMGLFAQQYSVFGKIKDEGGEPVTGAIVSVKGTTIGSGTDLDGNYALSIGSKNAVLVFSCMGYKTIEMNYTGQKEINVTLVEDTKLLDEVVVIGYGQVKKKDATGSLSVIKADLEGRGLAPNAQNLMVGKIAGVNVVTEGGSPSGGATIRIRGGSSLSASNDPLIVLDGVPLSNTAPGGVGNLLSSINPTDIESVTVLKDASATAIYGSRASNGVIIITTKKGTSGKVKITYDGNISLSHRYNQVDVLNGDEFRDFVRTTFAGASNEAEVVGKLGTDNTDWQNEIFKDAVSTEQNLSVYGSYKDIMPYRVSFGYTNLNGILETSNMERYVTGVSLTPTLFDKHLSMNLNGRGMYIKNRFAEQGAIGAAVSMDPTHPVMDPNSPYGGYWTWIGSDGQIQNVATKNPVAMLEMRDNTSSAYQFIGNAQFDYKLHWLPDLHFNLNLGMDYSKSDGENMAPADSPMEAMNGGYDNNWKNERKNSLLDFYAEYKKDLSFLESNLDVMAGYSWQHFWNGDSNIATRLSKYDKDGNLQLIENNDTENDLYLVSFFGRVNYSIYGKYLFTFTLRDDGSSRFYKDNRWGLFPAAALAWRINDEAFLKGVEAISNMKLRLGWGITGQQDLGADRLYPSLPLYQNSIGEAANYYRSGYWSPLIKPLAGNPDLKWEETTTYNAGLDFGFVNNRISGSVDLYKRTTKNLLNREIKVAAGSNFSEQVIGNIGTLQNNGVEFTLNTVPVATKDWTWEVGANLAYNKNKITQLTLGDNQSALIRGGNTGGDGGFELTANAVGHPSTMYYVYEQIYDESGKPIEGMYVDRNNDGVINEQDLYLYHKPSADFVFGFNTRLVWKAWDLSLASHGSLDNYNYNAVAANNAELAPARVYNNEFLGNRTKTAFDTDFYMKQVLSDYYVQDASFFRIDNITLGWSFKKSKMIPLSGRLYGSVQNPCVFTNYKGLDPEVYGGIDNNFYPRPMTFIFGANINF